MPLILLVVFLFVTSACHKNEPQGFQIIAQGVRMAVGAINSGATVSADLLAEGKTFSTSVGEGGDVTFYGSFKEGRALVPEEIQIYGVEIAGEGSFAVAENCRLSIANFARTCVLRGRNPDASVEVDQLTLTGDKIYLHLVVRKKLGTTSAAAVTSSVTFVPGTTLAGTFSVETEGGGECALTANFAISVSGSGTLNASVAFSASVTPSTPTAICAPVENLQAQIAGLGGVENGRTVDGTLGTGDFEATIAYMGRDFSVHQALPAGPTEASSVNGTCRYEGQVVADLALGTVTAACTDQQFNGESFHTLQCGGIYSARAAFSHFEPQAGAPACTAGQSYVSQCPADSGPQAIPVGAGVKVYGAGTCESISEAERVSACKAALVNVYHSEPAKLFEAPVWAWGRPTLPSTGTCAFPLPEFPVETGGVVLPGTF